MTNAEWLDFSGSAPILLPVRLLPLWRGIYLPTTSGENCPDLELPEGAFSICGEFDF